MERERNVYEYIRFVLHVVEQKERNIYEKSDKKRQRYLDVCLLKARFLRCNRNYIT